jgi:hypothetical protein
VDIVARVVWGVELDDPVDFGNVEPTRGDVGTEEDARGGVDVFKECIGTLLLLLLALVVSIRAVRSNQKEWGTHVQVQNGNIDIVQQLCVVLYRIATAEKDDDLFLEVALEKAKQEEEPLVALAHDIALLEHVDGTGRFLLVDVDVQRAGTERDARQVGDFGGLRGGKQHRLAVRSREELDDLLHFVFETDFEDAVGFVDDEGFEVFEYKAFGVLFVNYTPQPSGV